jgi:hypothetical protein
MATTQNTFTGDGSNLGPFSFTFKWLESTDIKVTVAGVLKTAGTHYNLQSLNYATKTGGQVLFTAGNAPANGAAIVVYRQTDDTDLAATFYSGSAIRAQDLNNNFIQGLYVTQESSNNAASATSTANSALTASASATATANAATSTANSAVSTANSAVSTANSAVSTANSAVSTANAASASAASAVATANTANTNATAALNAAAEALAYVIVANVAAIPASPVNGDAVRVTDSTGIQSFTPLSGLPVGFTGDSGLTVEIYYSSSTSTWVWVRYYATDSDSRYLKTTGGTLTGQLKADDSTSTALPVYSFDGDVNTGLAHPGADELALVTGGTVRLTVDPSGAVNVPVSLSVGANAVLNAGDIGVSVQAYNANILTSSAIGSTVQAYDADTAKTDVAQTFTAAQRGAYVTLTDAATIATDLSLGNQFQVTLGGNRTLGAPTNVVAGQSGVIRVVQDGTGSRTLAYNSVFKFPGGTAPTLTTTANAVDLLAYHVESTTRIAVRFIGDVK